MAESRLDRHVERFSPFTMNPWLGLSYGVAAALAAGYGLGWWALIGGCLGPVAYVALFLAVAAVLARGAANCGEDADGAPPQS